MPVLVSDVVGDRILVSVAALHQMAHLNRLFTFDTDCATPCRPADASDVDGQRFASMPVADGDVIYVGTAVDGGEGGLSAYDARCGLRASCRLWSLKEDEALNIPRPVVGDGVVVTAARFATHRIRAYAAGPVRPGDAVWTACCVYDISDALPIITDNVVYVPSLSSGITAYPVQCTTRPLCTPVWSWSGQRPSGGRGATSVAVGGGVLVAAGRADELVAFAPAAPARADPAAGSGAAAFYTAVGLVAVGLLLLRRRRRAPVDR
jgi:hypothetical protein